MSELEAESRRHRLAALTLALVCLASAGCGSSASTEEQKAKATVDTFLNACAHEQALIAEGTLAAPTRERFVNGGDSLEGCERVLGLSLASASREAAKEALRSAEVKIERIGGGFATALVEAPPSRRGTVELENLKTIGTEWKIYDPRPTPPAPAGDPSPPEPQPATPGP